MRKENGFIATSLLYAFLLCFLTLFLAYMANYLQNKQLVDQIKLMAQDNLESYKNKYVSDLEVGDYVIFDTISNVGNSTGAIAFESLINDNANWILFSKEGGDSFTDASGKVTYSDTVLKFVSDITATKFGQVYNANVTFDGEGNIVFKDRSEGGATNGGYLTVDLGNLNKLMNGSVYYRANNYSYEINPDAPADYKYNKVFRHSIPYTKKLDVRFLEARDFEELVDLDEAIVNNIIDEKSDYVYWNNQYGNYYGYNKLTKEMFDFEHGSDASYVNAVCGSGASYNTDGDIIFNNEFHNRDTDNVSPNHPTISFGHVYSGYAGQYVDYCYHFKYNEEDSNIGVCPDTGQICLNFFDWKICWNRRPSCSKLTGELPSRLVIEITFNRGDPDTDGYIDSGNGTSQLPYLITTGVKEE